MANQYIQKENPIAKFYEILKNEKPPVWAVGAVPIFNRNATRNAKENAILKYIAVYYIQNIVLAP